MHSIFDSHAHYDDKKFDEDRHSLLSSLPKAGICGVINCGVDIKTSEQSIALAEEYSFIYAACGFHPHESSKVECSDIDTLEKLLNHEKCLAVGEIGLDYYYDFSPRETQQRIFEIQLKIAKELDMPVIVHNRDAHQDTLDILKKYQPSGVLHCFSGSVEIAKEILKLGMYIGLGGAVTFKNARKSAEVAAIVPDDRLLIETDAPYMTPVPFRGKRCDSTHIPYTAEKLAEIRKIDVQTILNQTANNAKELFFKNKIKTT